MNKKKKMYLQPKKCRRRHFLGRFFVLLNVAVRDGHTKDAKPPSDSRFERGRGQDVVENTSDSRFG